METVIVQICVDCEDQNKQWESCGGVCGGFGGEVGTHVPSRSNYFHLNAVFSKNCGKNPDADIDWVYAN